jgi:alkanesulfonate monooxygenase SsuD/methylene tetrahydromethanopterin reductase-like flavin-dependent oxidoreductase (luciferase family)
MRLTPDRVAERSAQLTDLAEREGRPAPGTALLIGVHIDDDRARARAEAELHSRGQYRMGLEKIEHWTLLDSVDGAVEQLDAYSQAGVEEFVFMPLGREPLTQYERLAEVRRRFETAWTTSGASARGS